MNGLCVASRYAAIPRRGVLRAGLMAFGGLNVEILTADKARKAFDLSVEDSRLVAKYGNEWGQNILAARRLVEASVSFVTVSVPGGVNAMDAPGRDDHAVNIDLPTIMRYRLPVFDQVVATLVDDLFDRGLDQDVLIIVAGEFGRTPKGDAARRDGHKKDALGPRPLACRPVDPDFRRRPADGAGHRRNRQTRRLSHSSSGRSARRAGDVVPPPEDTARYAVSG